MKFLSENFKDLRPMLYNQLRIMLSAEEQLVRFLPPMVERATDEQLRQALQSHFQETEFQVKRLEGILIELKSANPSAESTSPIKCKAMAALIEEAEDMILDARESYVRDVALIAAAQRIEHYEIASYGALRHFAQTLGEKSIADLLDQTVQEEGHADQLLTAIADRVNPIATVAV